MKRKAIKQDREKLKILVNCTHDTAIGGVLESLQVFDQKQVSPPCGVRLIKS
jgi:hypothetical protein